MEEKETYMEEKRYCRKCGAELKGQGKFCPKCGEPILSEEPPKGKEERQKNCHSNDRNYWDIRNRDSSCI